MNAVAFEECFGQKLVFTPEGAVIVIYIILGKQNSFNLV